MWLKYNDAMEITKTLTANSKEEWRSWLQDNYRSEPEIWLIFYKQGSGQARILYNDAVEEALCFGWIDSQTKRIDQSKYAQRFSPRKKGSSYSQANRERLKHLIAQGRVMPEVFKDLAGLDLENFKIAEDILAAIQGNEQAWENFQLFSDSYKRIRISYIEGARNRPQEFQKRLAYFIKKTAANKQIGFGGIDKYY